LILCKLFQIMQIMILCKLYSKLAVSGALAISGALKQLHSYTCILKLMNEINTTGL
jgi:hypothetical protein